MRFLISFVALTGILLSAHVYAQGYDGLISSNKDTSNSPSATGGYAGVLGSSTDTRTTAPPAFADLYSSGNAKSLTPDQRKAAEMRAEVQKSRAEKRKALEKANAERAQKEEKERLKKEGQEKIKSGGR
jgi:hypothetical protein